MLRRAAFALIIAGSAGSTACGSCGDNSGPAPLDARSRDAATAADADLAVDGDVPLAWIDFAITGCTSGPTQDDAGVSTPCTGTAPLALSFAAISPAQVDIYRWAFGDDGAESTESSPAHIYLSPGSYDVGLAVGGPGGTATESKSAIIVVASAVLGSPCGSDPQCGTGLECVCSDAASCGNVLPNGLCAADCGGGCEQGVCADLDAASVGGADWRRPLCLPACTDTSDCAPGLTCQDLRDPTGTGWVRACFAPGVLGTLGDSCLAADGQPAHASCASGQCSALGARGACSIACSGGDCPDGSACATFDDLAIGALCVDRCEVATECERDPWLRCQAPGGVGDKSFTVDETAAAAGYCAPRSCAGPDECGPDGACVAGFCEPAP